MGAAYGTAKSGVGIAAMGVFRPELVMKSIVPVVMAGVLGIYGLIIAVIISTNTSPGGTYTLFQGYAHLGSGLSCGLSDTCDILRSLPSRTPGALAWEKRRCREPACLASQLQ